MTDIEEAIDRLKDEVVHLENAIKVHYTEQGANVLRNDIQTLINAVNDKWISVSERLPEAGKEVLFTCKRHSEICLGYKEKDDPESMLWIDKT